MLASLLFRKKPQQPFHEEPSKYLRAKSGKELISTPERQSIIKKVKRAFSVTDDVWNEHYLFAIEQFAELAQELPASEIHHHSKEGGLIDHTLEAVFAGVRVTQGYILPPNTEAEKIKKGSNDNNHDEIKIYLRYQGTNYVYQVESTRVVSPDNLQVLDSNNQTGFACVPWECFDCRSIYLSPKTL